MATVAITLAITAGAMALQYLMTPRIRQQPTDVGKLDDIRITGSEYGAFIPRFWGQARMGGNVVWSSGIEHTVLESPSDGGKGAPAGASTRTHIYTTDMGVLVCRGPVTNFLRIWEDQDLRFSNGEYGTATYEAEDGTRAGGATVASSGSASGGEYVTNLGSGGKVTITASLIADPDRPRSEDNEEVATKATRVEIFYKCAADRTATVKSLDNSVYETQTVTFPASADWTAKTVWFENFSETVSIENASAAAPDVDYITVQKRWITTGGGDELLPKFAVTGSINQAIAYPPDLDDPSPYWNAAWTTDANGLVSIAGAAAADTARFYKGTESQLQDSALVAYLDQRYGTGEGSLRAPAHRGLALAVFENYTLREGRVPNFTFEVENGQTSVNDVLEDLLGDVGIGSGDRVLTQTAALTQLGYAETTASSRRAHCENLCRYHGFRLAEIDGKVTTVADSWTPAGTIGADLLRAHDAGDEMPAFDAEVLVRDDRDLPREVRVSVMNPDLEYHNESVSARLFAGVSGQEAKEYTFPIVDTAQSARSAAERLLLKSHTETQAVEFQGMPELAKYAIGDVVTVTIGGVQANVRIEKKQMTLPLGAIRFQGVTVAPYNVTEYLQDDFTELAATSSAQLAEYNFPRNAVAVPIVSLPLTAAERGRLGVYLAVSGRGRGAAGAIAVYRERGDENYALEYVADSPATVGLCAGTLATASTYAEDTTNTLDIWFFDDASLESVTAGELTRFPTLNLLRVGGEWVQFRTAAAQTLESGSPYRSKWRVSNLRRGLFGTSGAVGTHSSKEYAVLVTRSLRFLDLDEADIGEDVTIKAVTSGQPVEVAPATTFEFSPVSNYTVTGGVSDYRELNARDTTIHNLSDVVRAIIKDLNL